MLIRTGYKSESGLPRRWVLEIILHVNQGPDNKNSDSIALHSVKEEKRKRCFFRMLKKKFTFFIATICLDLEIPAFQTLSGKASIIK